MITNKAYKVILLSTAFLLILVCLSFARTDHRQYRDSKLDECQDCHSGSGVINNHGAFFVQEHRFLAQKAGNNCADCHQQSFCVDCHQGGGITTDLQRGPSRRGEYKPRTHRSDFISIHSIKAADNPQNCYRCHQSSFCTDCHSRTRQKGNMNIKSHRKAGPLLQVYDWNSDHAAEARRNLQSCESCHPDADVCVQCHSSGKASPHPRNWRSIYKRYKDESNGRTCRKCHITY
mgnify:CR=1 FL=1